MKKYISFIILVFISINIFAQNKQKPLTFDDILKWNRITEKIISNDGNTVVYKVAPWTGNTVLKIANKSGKELRSITSGTSARISCDSKYVLFTIKPRTELIRELKLKKTKKENMPKNKLGIFEVQSLKLDTINNLKSYKLPKKWSGYIAYQVEKETIKDTAKKKLNKEELDDEGYMLTVKNLDKGNKIEFPFVTDYIFAEKKEILAFVSAGDNKNFKPGVYYYNLKNKTQKAILLAKGKYKQLSFNKNGDRLAFLADTISNKEDSYNLYYWDNTSGIQEIANNTNKNIQENWEISENGNIKFSEKTNRIFFGTAPIKPEEDTTILKEEIPKLDIWKWNEPVLHSQQLYSKETDLKKTYLAVCNLINKEVVQLETPDYTSIELINDGDADYVLAYSNLPYSVQIMWEGYPYHNDFYLINIKTGKSELIKKDCRAIPEVSPNGKYLYWYSAIDTSWNTFNLKEKKEYKITSPNTVQCADELNDVPNLAFDYGSLGWLKNDEALLIYDRYDVWKIDPENKLMPINLTVNGRQNKINYHYLNFNRIGRWNEDEKGIDISKTVYLTGHNEITREDSYYKTSFIKANAPKELLLGKFELSYPIKAKDANVFIYTKESFKQFPDLLLSKNEFKNAKTISNVNPQQKEFLWGTKELYSWTSIDGRKLEGLLIKPANFDPNKKYPMIVNFYEKSSQELYHHQIPEANRSTVDYHYYSSNGYVIFNPDVYYKEGYPGEDAVNCVMPGVTQLINDGFIDKNHIAAQGHSWGGYQVAYLATRTNLFAAIESGAPVVNMYSAYGGIRLWSGRNRSFQYEHTQSRLGKSIWESPLRYLESSPLFFADKIQTPLLIMHNENDGAVPFDQGVEFFIALRRLGKQAWLLNYNEADHWPTIVRDKYDFQIRMAQFFDHFLKEKPMPLWMEEGIPAINKTHETEYNIIK